LFLHDETVALRAKWVDLEHVRSTAVVVRIDQNFKVVIQILTHVAAEFRRHNSRCLRVVTTDAEVNRVPRVENAHFCSLGSQLVLEWLLLTKIGDRFGIQPEGIIQSAVQFWACSTGTASAIRASV
jgi:hypothetical protein